MVKEIECQHCTAKATPTRCFSSGTFALLLILGIIPFTLNLAGYVILYNAIAPLIGILKMMPDSLPIPPNNLPIDIPPAMIEFITTLNISLGIMSVASLILYLVIGIIPAVVYWAFRHDAYKCPVCEMPI